MINEATIKIRKIPKKILIIKPSSLGDIIHSLPFLNAIKAHFESSEIHWVIAKGLENLLETHPMIRKLILINKDDWKNLRNVKNTFAELSMLYTELGNESYDIVIDLQGLLRSGFLTFATGAPLRIGFSEAREGSIFFYTHKIKGGKEIHAVDRYLKIASAIGCNVEEVIFPMPLIHETESIRGLKTLIKEYAVIVPGARWKTKQWFPERFAQLISLLNIKSIIIGSKYDEMISDFIISHSDGKAISIAGKTTLNELIHLIRGAKMVITNDSGPMHIAAACGIPIIAIFGPTNPTRTGPYGGNHIIIKSDIPCSPCYKKKCKSMKCLDSISVEHIYQTMKNKGVIGGTNEIK